MSRYLCGLILILCLLCVPGCTSTMEGINKGAEDVGKAGGQVLRLPSSVSEGAAAGIAGEAESNPYNR